MGFRFRKSIKILPGVRLNLSNGSPSLSVGRRGASITFGSRGTYANLGLPGTGLSYRTRLDRPPHSGYGNRTAKEHLLKDELEQTASDYMSVVAAICNIHEFTPDPKVGMTWAILESTYFKSRLAPFSIPAPQCPDKPEYLSYSEQPGENDGISFLGRWFESDFNRAKRQAENIKNWQLQVIDIEQKNNDIYRLYQHQKTVWNEQYTNWKRDAKEYEVRLTSTSSDIRRQFLSDAAFFESQLASVLAETEWPRETLVAFEVNAEQSTVLVDVDLAEIEDMPDKIYTVNARETTLTEKVMTQTVVRKNYARYVHGSLFRLAGIVFHTLPFNNVIISGFTQRINKKNGHLEDEYIVSFKCSRDEMTSINYEHLDKLDPILALGEFPIMRDMSATHIFQKIKPFTLT
ncbi:DUF4236 domain-containing protein [Aeromonas veronii]